MELEPRTPTATAPAERFTGNVHVDAVRTPRGPSRLIASLVRFTPGARTNRHSHHLGQALHCTDGEGFVVTRDGDGTPWLEPVTDEQCRQAHGA